MVFSWLWYEHELYLWFFEWVDNLDMVTWSPLMLENMIEDIGYEMRGRMKVHYLIPILTMARNGLREIRDVDDIAAMFKWVDMGHQFISIYLDHEESYSAMNWDDVFDFPVANLHPILSRVKPLQTVVADAEDKDSCVDMEGKEETRSKSEESDDDLDSDYQINDSENDISEDDADLYAYIVDDTDIGANDAEEKKKTEGQRDSAPKTEGQRDSKAKAGVLQ
jgi:hypothetical protein